jgi:hypothetical protein
MAIEQINPGAAPLLWSTVDDAFKKINDNFTELALSVGLGNVVDLTALASTIAPIDDNTHDLGKLDSRWRDLYLDQFIYLGGARVGSAGNVVNLPAGSTIGDSGQLLDESYFKTIRVPGQDDVVADNGIDLLTLSAGVGVGITTAESTDTITFTNTGVTSISTGTGISINSSTGAVAVTNTGVTNLTGTAGQIGISASTGSVVLTNLGVIQLTTDPGSGIGLSATSGSINISNLAPNIAQNVFRFISIPGQDIIEADTIADTLTLTPGYGITLTATALTDTVTIELNQNIDINGSVFADDSSAMVDAVDQKMFAAGGFFGELIGNVTGDTNGLHTGNIIGDVTGSVFADDSTLLVDGVDGKIVGPISSFDSINSIIMDPIQGLLMGSAGLIDIQGAAGAQIGIGAGTSGDVFIGSGSNSIIINGTLKTSTITSDDSSQITIIPQTQFNSNVVVDGDLVLNGDNRIQANTKITVVPTLSAESSGSILNITGFPAGEGSSGVVVSSPSEFIQIGTWVMFADGGLFSVPLADPPDNPIIGTIYIANGNSWDPQNFLSGNPYPVFYDGNDFLPMVPAPSP